ncbi:MAG TPA: nickel/cobalt transporter [Pseudolabrys sp.]|nr:nickel/cobalt transporter [Pseudolabrys sp.]
MTRAVRYAGLCVLCIVLAAVAADVVLAQPFGIAHRSGPPHLGPFAGWILAKQAEFYRMMSGAIRAAKTDGTAAWTLLGISFLYGIFHAAGPGHGKAVISSYLVANNETWRRGVALSFIAAVIQSLTAVAIVGIAAILLGATAKMMGDTVRVIEEVSYALIILIGLRLLWVKGRALWRLLRPQEPAHHHDRHHHHDHGPGHHHHEGEEASAWAHAHVPEPQELAGKRWLRRGLSAVVAVGLRPCSGAIIVLVFALAQGLFWIGVASTLVMGVGTAITVAAIAIVAVSARGFAGRLAKARPGAGMIALRGLETAAAGLILVFGMLLLAGYAASEQMGLF